MATQIIIPQLGNEITEAEITEWLVQEGGEVSEGDPVLIITTTKMAIEIEAPAGGRLARTLVQEGDLVTVGTIAGEIE